MRHELVYAILPNIADRLDVDRATYKKLLEKIPILVEKCISQFGISDIRVPFSERRGYVMTIPASKKKQLPLDAFQPVQRGKFVHFTTKELASLNNRIQETFIAIVKQSESILETFSASLNCSEAISLIS